MLVSKEQKIEDFNMIAYLDEGILGRQPGLWPQVAAVNVANDWVLNGSSLPLNDWQKRFYINFSTQTEHHRLIAANGNVIQ